MTEEFNQAEQIAQMDLKWLLSRGWTIKSNLAYREILHHYNPRTDFKRELIEEIAIKYELDFEEMERIKVALKEFLEVTKSISQICKAAEGDS